MQLNQSQSIFMVISRYRHSVEISNGFGITKGIIFRIGTMNTNATSQKVDLVLRSLYEALKITANFIAPQTKVYY